LIAGFSFLLWLCLKRIDLSRWFRLSSLLLKIESRVKILARSGWSLILGHESGTKRNAQQSVHRTAGGLRVLSLIQARDLVPFRKLVLPAAGNAGRWALKSEQ
jgi:hypothetical protein